MSIRILVASGIALVHGCVLACGVCVEDKVAATYDHAVVTRALSSGRVVVFTAIDGHAPPSRLVAEVKRAAIRVPGIERTSLRSANNPPTLSFALDSHVTSAAAAVSAIEQNVRHEGLKVALIRVMK